MNFLGMGPAELVFILIIAVIVLGPGKLPEVARALGKTMRDFRSISDGFQSELRKELDTASSTVKEDGKPLSDLSDSLASIRSSLNSPLTTVSSEAEKPAEASAENEKTDVKKSTEVSATAAASAGEGVASVQSRPTDETDDSFATHYRETKGNESEGESETVGATAPQKETEEASSVLDDGQSLEYTPSVSESAEQNPSD